MISTRWLEKRKPHWAKLEALLNQSSNSGLKSLSRSDLQELSLLYRQTAADLAAFCRSRGSVHYARMSASCWSAPTIPSIPATERAPWP
jgi:hypothetical protein